VSETIYTTINFTRNSVMEVSALAVQQWDLKSLLSSST